MSEKMASDRESRDITRSLVIVKRTRKLRLEFPGSQRKLLLTVFHCPRSVLQKGQCFKKTSIRSTHHLRPWTHPDIHQMFLFEIPDTKAADATQYDLLPSAPLGLPTNSLTVRAPFPEALASVLTTSKVHPKCFQESESLYG